LPLEWIRIGRSLGGDDVSFSSTMMNFWTKDNKLSESSIKEANDQMHGMHCRILDLEQRVREQTELMERRDQQFAARYNQMKHEKDAVIANMQLEMRKIEEKYGNLEKSIREKDVNLAYLLHRCSYLDEAASYAPLLDQLSNCLKNAFAAPPPKVQTVKPTRTTVGITDKPLVQPANPPPNGIITRSNTDDK